MMRLLSPDTACIQADTSAGRLTGRIVDVDNPRAIRELRAGGYTPADVSGGPVRAAGFVCECGRRNYFRVCGRCGAEAEAAAA